MQNEEFILSNASKKITKKLLKIDDISFFTDEFKDFVYFSKIQENFWEKISHIWYDFVNNRKKIYISLYFETFENSLKIIKKCKGILWITESYFLEKNFIKFDCLGIDFYENGTADLKIYEIIKSEDFSLLPYFIEKNNVKEMGFLKTFSGRKKQFFRFLNPIDIKDFEPIFDISEVPHAKVKYFCQENTKKEIYFIKNP